MATIEICDVCGCSENVSRRQLNIGQSFNGVDYDDDGETIDLCPKCEVKVIRTAVYKLLKELERKHPVDIKRMLNQFTIDSYHQISTRSQK